MKSKPDPYKRLTGVNCGCTGCRSNAYAQFYICALDAWVAICKECDLRINRAVLEIVTTYNHYEVDKWMDTYRLIPADSPRRKFVSAKPSGGKT